MDIFIFLQDLCYRLFYGYSIHQATSVTYTPTQTKTMSRDVVTKMSFYDESSFDSTGLSSRAFAPSPAGISPKMASFTPYVSPAPAARGPEINLTQSLENQIHELENETQAILADISIKRSEQTSLKAIFSSSHLTCDENVKKHVELAKLNHRLEETSDFCNQEMMEVLDRVMESSASLDEKLAKLRQEAAFATDDAVLCESIERIAILEKAMEALHQLEAQFQKMQKAARVSNNPTSQTKQEAHVSSLLEKVEKLNQQKQFLNACKQSLPLDGAYDAEELEGLLQLFENEGKELSQKTRESKHKLVQAEQFAHELTHHLLDYAEVFNDYLQKLESRPFILKPAVTRLDPTYTAQAQVRSVEGKFNPDALKAAALEVTKALKDLMQLESEV